MKKIVLSLLFFFVCFACFSQNERRRSINEQVCHIGFTYEISNSPHWGYGKPVVTSVHPYSTAGQNGLQINDIIETIDSTPVSEMSQEEITIRLNTLGKEQTILGISNLTSNDNKIWIKKECKPVNSISEAQIAKAFFLYSPETTAERVFMCPFTTTVTLEYIDLSRFKTFAFTVSEDGNSELELLINDCIEQELLKKGLSIDFIQPDILIQTYYFFDKNPKFKGRNKIEVNKTPVYRYDTNLNSMVQLPFLTPSAGETEAEYLLNLGFRMVDQKLSPGRIVWECEAKELLDDIFTLENYARIHIPLMCMQYPYVKHERGVPFKVNQALYNYTGIRYDMESLGRISEVERNSPAAAAGLRRGDQIEIIGSDPLPGSWEELSAAYEKFVKGTNSYRDVTTRFHHPDYGMSSMYWDKDFYAQIAEEFRKPENNTPFAYLFSYAPYIDPSIANRCKFVIKRGNSQQEFIIRPSLRMEQTLSIAK